MQHPKEKPTPPGGPKRERDRAAERLREFTDQRSSNDTAAEEASEKELDDSLPRDTRRSPKRKPEHG